MNTNTKIMLAVAALLIGAAGFLGGMQYQKTQAATATGSGQFQGGVRQGGQRGAGRFGNGQGAPVVGQILSQDANSITVKLQDGSSKIVLLPDNSSITKTDTASKSDLTVGQRVAVFGTTNSDGSVTAQNVQVNPMFGRLNASPRPTQ